MQPKAWAHFEESARCRREPSSQSVHCGTRGATDARIAAILIAAWQLSLPRARGQQPPFAQFWRWYRPVPSSNAVLCRVRTADVVISSRRHSSQRACGPQPLSHFLMIVVVYGRNHVRVISKAEKPWRLITFRGRATSRYSMTALLERGSWHACERILSIPPMKGRNGSGIVTEPSACTVFSDIPTIILGSAHAVAFSMCTIFFSEMILGDSLCFMFSPCA